MGKQAKHNGLSKIVGLKLQKLRLEKGLTLEQLAYECDMELTQVHRVLNGSHDSQLTTIYRIAKVLDITLSDLLQGIK